MFSVFGLYSYIRSNRRKTAVLFFLLFILAYIFLFCIYLFFHKSSIPTDTIALSHATRSDYDYGRAMDLYLLAVIIEAWGTFFRWSPVVLALVVCWIVIGVLFYRYFLSRPIGAERVTRIAQPRVYNILETLSITAGMRLPALYIIETRSLNAFAMALTPDYAAIAVTQGLIDQLDDTELDAVLAHELTHIINRDSLLMVTAVVITGAMTFVAELILRLGFGWGKRSGQGTVVSDPTQGNDSWSGWARFLFLFNHGKIMVILRGLLTGLLMSIIWFGALLVRFAISRNREYLADAGAIELTKNPDALIAALLKIEGNADVFAIPSSAMQMCFDNPRTDFMRMFATHPSVADRVQRLIDVCGGRLPEIKTKTKRTFDSSKFG